MPMLATGGKSVFICGYSLLKDLVGEDVDLAGIRARLFE
jgi:hypothetical protein